MRSRAVAGRRGRGRLMTAAPWFASTICRCSSDPLQPRFARGAHHASDGRTGASKIRRAVTHDVLVLGGGAAGLSAAAVAGRRGRRVAVLERNRVPGRKILISGGGRCNFTNLYCRAGEFSLGQSALLRAPRSRATRRPTSSALVERARHRLSREETRTAVLRWLLAARLSTLLLAECAAAAVDVVLIATCRASRSRRAFVVRHQRRHLRGAVAGRRHAADCRFRSSARRDFGYRHRARSSACAIVELRPGRVPLMFAPDDDRALRRSAERRRGAGDRAPPTAPPFAENLLFTHRGLSGPRSCRFRRIGRRRCARLRPAARRRCTGAGCSSRERGDRADDQVIVRGTLAAPSRAMLVRRDAPAAVVAMTGNDDVRALADGLQHGRTPSGTEGYDEGRGHAGRRGHARAVVENDGGARAFRACISSARSWT